MTDKEKIIEAFKFVKALGFVESHRSHNTGIGKTFEDYMNVPENNYAAPDLFGFEIKSKRERSKSYLTLFTKSPSHPYGVNTYLRDTYGTSYDGFPSLKKLHTSIFSNRRNTYCQKYGFQIINDVEHKKLIIEISDLKTDTILENNIYFTYDDLENCLKTKMKDLLFVYADTKVENGKELFHFTKAEIFYNPSLEKLLTMVNEGKLMIDIRLGYYMSGKLQGQSHDHGTAFRLIPSDLLRLYEVNEVIQ